MISSALRALHILEAIGRADRPLGATEIARQLGLAPGNVARSESSPRYVAGPVVNQLRQALLARFSLREVALPYLRQLAFATGEAVSVTIKVGWYALRLAAVPGTNEVTSSPPIGDVRPLERTCAGQAILAFLPRDCLHNYCDSAAAAAIAGRQGSSIAEMVRHIRKRGFAIEVASYARNRAAAAFPVRGIAGPIAAIGIEGPVLHLDRVGYHDNVNQWIEIVGSLERVVRARPAMFGAPFGHLDPGDIALSFAQ
jgi:DNA-binding IclR family transcriptional regulator